MEVSRTPGNCGPCHFTSAASSANLRLRQKAALHFRATAFLLAAHVVDAVRKCLEKFIFLIIQTCYIPYEMPQSLINKNHTRPDQTRPDQFAEEDSARTVIRLRISSHCNQSQIQIILSGARS